MASIHEVAVNKRRAAAGDRDAASNYQRLALLHPCRADEFLKQADEALASAARHESHIAARMAGRRVA